MRKQKPIHGAGPPGKPLLPLEAEVEILEKLGADLRIGSGEIAAILKKHGVEADVERLQDSYRKRLGQRLMASIRDEEGRREVLARGSEYIVVECCSDQQALKAIRHRIHREMIDRVTSCSDYNKALHIISEYVETELTPPPIHQRSNKKKARDAHER